jgi:phosphate-selective porin OprO/OprP
MRYSELRIDDAAFPVFADPALSVHAAREFAGGINWYLTDYVKLMISYHRTDFQGGAGKGDRDPENAIMGRLQLAL